MICRSALVRLPDLWVWGYSVVRRWKGLYFPIPVRIVSEGLCILIQPFLLIR